MIRIAGSNKDMVIMNANGHILDIGSLINAPPSGANSENAMTTPNEPINPKTNPKIIAKKRILMYLKLT